MDFSAWTEQIDPTTKNEKLYEDIKGFLQFHHDVEFFRKLTGKYSDLVSFYVKDRLDSYQAAGYKCLDLAEVLYADFEGWNDEDFNAVAPKLLRDLRDYIYSNGIIVEKKPGLRINKALAAVIFDPENIPVRSREELKNAVGQKGNVTSNRNTDIPQGLLLSSRQKPPSQNGGSFDNRVERLNKDAVKNPKRSNLTNITKCIDKEMKYSGLPDEDIDAKISHFRDALEIVGVTEEHDKLCAIPFFLHGQAALTYRTSIKGKAESFEHAIQLMKESFLSEEARRANDNIWDAISFEYIRHTHATKSHRDTLQKLFSELERLRNCTSHAAKANSETIDYITRAKLLASVSTVDCFMHVRSNPPQEYLRLRNALYDAGTQADMRKQKLNTMTLTRDELSSFITDRRFNSRKAKAGKVRRTVEETKRYAGNEKTCWVCGNLGCHSSNHPRDERRKLRNKLKSYFNAMLGSSDDSDFSDDSDGDEPEDCEPIPESFVTSLETSNFVLQTGANPAHYSQFVGIALDTCCTRYCTSSKNQYLAYCDYTGQIPNIITSQKQFNTSGGHVSSIGFAHVTIPFGILKRILYLKVYIFDYPSMAPMLLAYDVMKEHGWNMIITEKRLVSGRNPERFANYDEVNKLPVYRWHPNLNRELVLARCVSLYTAQQLRNIHRRAGHPSTERLMKVLERLPTAEHLQPDTRAMLTRIAKSCKACQIMTKPPERFRIVLHDETRFNHEIIVDIFTLSDGKVLHVVCSGTKYQLGKFIDDDSAETAWDTLRQCWVDVLSGPPDIIKVDAGSTFRAKYFKRMAMSYGIAVEVVPTEAHNKIGLVERYHKVVRNVYEKLKIDDPMMTRESRLSLTFRCVNDSVGIDGIVPTLLVFGSYPRFNQIQDDIAPTTRQRAKAVRNAMKLSQDLLNARRIKQAAQNGPNANVLRIEAVKQLHKNAPVLVYRERKGWTGPLPLIGTDEHGAWVLNEQGSEIRVSLTVVKPFIPEDWTDPLPFSCFARCKNPIFIESRRKELTNILNRNVMHLVDKSEARGHRVYRGSYIDQLKSNGESKSRLVVCATNDHLNVLTYSPTVQRMSTRIAFCYAACRSELYATCRDVTTAFLQSDTKLRRPVYLELPYELKAKHSGKVFKVTKPLYGLPESPVNWYTTYTSHYKNQLNMSSAPHDPCFLYTSMPNSPSDGIVLLQVDDSITFGTKNFHEKEEKASLRFTNHGAKRISDDPIQHNGANITFSQKKYSLDQSANVKKVCKIPADLPRDKAYERLRSQNAAAAYPASLTRPDFLCYTSKFSQVTKTSYTESVRREFNKFVVYMEQNQSVPMNYVDLDMNTLYIAVFTDASFSTAEQNSSQIGIAVLLRDATGKCNIIHASSKKSRRRARSVLAAEMFGLLDGFDYGYVIRHLLSKLLGRKVELHLFTDSRSTYHVVTTLVTTKEKRLMLDVHLLRESYERREITKVNWIAGKSNIADCLTKTRHNGSLLMCMKSNFLNISLEGWVDRDVRPVHAIKEWEQTTAELAQLQSSAQRIIQHSSNTQCNTLITYDSNNFQHLPLARIQFHCESQ